MGIASSVLNSGCSGKLYFPAGKCPNLKDRMCAEHSHCVPIAVYACGGCKDEYKKETEEEQGR